MRQVASASMLAAALAGCSDAMTPRSETPEAPLTPSLSRGAEPVANQYIVLLKQGHDARKASGEIAAASGGRVMHVYSAALQGFSLRVPAAALDGIRRNPMVAQVEQDAVVRSQGQLAPTGVRRVGATQNAVAKIDGVDDPMDVDIAILDSGIDPTHPDLRVAQFKNCIDASNNDGYGHGTHVAGIAAARDNADGVVGVAPGARLWAVKVLDDYGSGTLSSVLCGLDHVTANAASIEVANMSLGAIMQSDAMRSAVQSVVNAGVFLAVAAGNNRGDVYGADGVFNTSDDFIPAAYPEVAAISASADADGKTGGEGNSFTLCSTTVLDDSFACFSNNSATAVGSQVLSPGGAIDLAAPGVGILSTFRGGSYATMNGTSMASPHVAGAAALHIVQQRTRDLNGDGVVNAADVYVLRQALVDAGQPQSSWRADGQITDRDSNREPMLQLVATVVEEPVTAPAVAPEVTPDLGTASATAGTTANLVTFTVANRSTSESESFTLACAADGTVVASCVSPASITVAPGSAANVDVAFATGTAGTGSVRLTATGLGGSDAGSITVSVTAPVVNTPTTPAMHVHAVDLGSAFKSSGTEITASVSLFDHLEIGVKEGTVVGSWYKNGTLLDASSAGVTNGGGIARLKKRFSLAKGDVVQLCITGASKSGLTYDPTMNHVTCAQQTF